MTRYYDSDADEAAIYCDLGVATPQKETEKALQVILSATLQTRWIPKSVIHDDSECYSMRSGPGRLFVEYWWAEKEGLT